MKERRVRVGNAALDDIYHAAPHYKAPAELVRAEDRRKVKALRKLDERRAFNRIESTATIDKETFSLLVPDTLEEFSRVEKEEGRVECPKSLRYLDVVEDTDTDGKSESQRLLLMRDGLVVRFTPSREGRQGNRQFLIFDIWCYRDANINSLGKFREQHGWPTR